MKINRVTAGVQIRGDYQKCFDFYTQKLGLVPIYGDEHGPYTSFADQKGGEPFFALYAAKDASERLDEYVLPSNVESSDTLTAVFHTTNFYSDYNRLLEAGITFIGMKNFANDGFDFNMAYFRDPEGNLLSLEDGGV
ncbi:MAG: VOC family protein [Oscillospiraceae bacterium]|nr:VOC family protein [Oscillospiraceae bacterium]